MSVPRIHTSQCKNFERDEKAERISSWRKEGSNIFYNELDCILFPVLVFISENVFSIQ